MLEPEYDHVQVLGEGTLEDGPLRLVGEVDFAEASEYHPHNNWTQVVTQPTDLRQAGAKFVPTGRGLTSGIGLRSQPRSYNKKKQPLCAPTAPVRVDAGEVSWVHDPRWCVVPSLRQGLEPAVIIHMQLSISAHFIQEQERPLQLLGVQALVKVRQERQHNHLMHTTLHGCMGIAIINGPR